MTRAGNLRAPRQVEVFSEKSDARIEATQHGEQIGAHQRATTGRAEHVAHGVVLLLIELAGLDERRGHAGLVGGLTDAQDPRRVVPLHDLGCDHARVRAERLFDHRSDRVGRERDVVVAEQEERRPFDDVEHLVGGHAEPRVGIESPDVGRGQHASDRRRRVVRAVGVDDQDRQGEVVLVAQRDQGLVEPVPRVVGDDHGDHGRRHCRTGEGVEVGFLGTDVGGVDHDRVTLIALEPIRDACPGVLCLQ